MAEIKGEIKTYIIQYACDDCEKIPNPGCILNKRELVLLTHPPIYSYECPSCKKKYKFSKSYPGFENELIE
jgi:hypothetical protein